MANEFSIIIDGFHVKEIRCKNDACRTLLGYENVRVGILIFTCPKCDFISVFNMRYNDVAKQFMSKIEKTFAKGGEKING